MRYFVFLALILAGCTTRYDAQVAQANAQQAQAQAAIIQAQEQARMFQQLAESSKPTYWPIVAVVVVFGVIILLFMRWHMVTISHVSAGRPVYTEELRLLPGQPGFNRELRLLAAARGERATRSGDNYYLVDADGQRTPVRQLTVRQ